ncbi:ABC transporter ATP-binding protein [Rarobacter faecitabidus]|uniref:ABC-2 type transport system ATP-binding protein n=1 Tax=Rarobacter faecitabidus TaxID=13243 RepID=A0A542ZE42_RARFA|nr:ABC transporter ATP-binding protein [Rarobacter faecitabidus]TQL58603.1 ABC-2 type transport system ATP-binding protein [Rarobacter faecitabidus]
MADPSGPAVVTTSLRKTYRTFSGRKVVAVENLDLTVPRGGVHGFLGPNGSGKTTTIRMMLGLTRPDSGTVELLGQPIPRALPAVVQRVGAIVEQPKFYPYFTGRENLIQLALAIGVPRRRVDQVLEQVDLTGRARHRYRTYSLGMKQRLAIAATLLKDPELLIFDEPTNGLDPAGIREVRGTMRELAGQGKTVLVSSHILAEVEQVADTVSIIGRGTVIAQGRVDELLAARGGASIRVGLKMSELASGLITLQTSGFATRVEGAHIVVSGEADPSEVNRTLARSGIFASELTPQGGGLEDLFLELTAGEVTGGNVDPAPRPAGGGEAR